MNTPTIQRPARRADLVIKPIGEEGRHVVKDPKRRDYFEIGEEEHFLLTQFDGERTAEDVCKAFEKEFGEPLSEEDLDGFIEMARGRGLLEASGGRESPGAELGPAVQQDRGADVPRSPKRQSILYWRKAFFDPDCLFNWLEPKIRFFWTRGFLAFSAGCIVLATLILWTGRQEAASSFSNALRWETLFLAWLTLFLVTTLHEFAHGLTCKHYGGEVHEIGFLALFFMPCFYCNVSDAWLFRERSKRLWVTLAGGYFELFLWALSVFIWRVTVPDSLINYLAFIVLAVCGVGSFFNFNPLIKLDGYYLLSDWVEIPNLRQRALQRLMSALRWVLWGAAKPAGGILGDKRTRFLLGFGITSWFYSLLFLGLMIFAMSRFIGSKWGPIGFGAVVVFGMVTMKGLFTGISHGEARQMILKRHKRTAGWLVVLGTLGAVLGFVEIEDRVGGPCEIRSAVRAELRAPVAGFLKEVYFDEGDHVSPGEPIAQLDIPDLDSRLAQKQAEMEEAQAKLTLLQTGTRPEELAEQRQRVRRAEHLKHRAEQELARRQQALEHDLVGLDETITQHQAEMEAAEDAMQRAEQILPQKAVSEVEYQQKRAAFRVAQALCEQAKAEKRSREVIGTLQFEAELALRVKELAEERGKLTLLEAGSRPEEIVAAEAQLSRLREEQRYLDRLRAKLPLQSPASGLITTPKLSEQVGRHLQEGDLLCTVEDPAILEALIVLPEGKIEHVRAGQPVTLKVRGYPYETFHSRVDRIAPIADAGFGPAETGTHRSVRAASPEVSKTVTVYCRLDSRQPALRPGFTGYARIATTRRPLGEILLDRTLRFLRTEFWW